MLGRSSSGCFESQIDVLVLSVFLSSFNLLRSSFSNNFDGTGNNYIGLKEIASEAGFPGCSIIITSVFQ